MKRWLHVELERGKEETAFRKFLVDTGVVYESSGAYNLVHFSCLMNEEEERQANDILESI